MFKFGFELEGFYKPDGQLSPPPPKYPTDGFPGLVELRTRGAYNLDEAYAALLCEYFKYSDVDFTSCVEMFDSKQRAILRRRYEHKTIADIRNLYNKTPKSLGNKTIASLQINISNVLSTEYRDKDGHLYPTRYGLFDIPAVVRALDENFHREISRARRQPGEYCVKDGVRLEYRSLPNFAFETDLRKVSEFLKKISSAVQQGED